MWEKRYFDRRWRFDRGLSSPPVPFPSLLSTLGLSLDENFVSARFDLPPEQRCMFPKQLVHSCEPSY